MAGVFDAPMRTVMERTGQPVIVDLTLYYFDRYPDPGSELGLQTPDDRMTFEVDETTLGLSTVYEGSEILSPLLSATSIRDLIIRIEGVQDLTWYWIDIHLCTAAWFGEETAPGVLRAPRLWESALAPWLPWVH
jgi:hypothetical protein